MRYKLYGRYQNPGLGGLDFLFECEGRRRSLRAIVVCDGISGAASGRLLRALGFRRSVQAVSRAIAFFVLPATP